MPCAWTCRGTRSRGAGLGVHDAENVVVESTIEKVVCMLVYILVLTVVIVAAAGVIVTLKSLIAAMAVTVIWKDDQN